jgi:hypothetical protein
LILLYLLMGLIEVATEFLTDSYFSIWLSLFTVVLLLYCTLLNEEILLFITMVLLLMVIFHTKGTDMLFYALVAVFFYRITQIYYIVKLIKIKDYIPSVLASIPFLIFFLYLVSIPEGVLISSYVVLTVQIVVISLLSGIILSQYLSNFNKTTQLCRFGLMSLMQTSWY